MLALMYTWSEKTEISLYEYYIIGCSTGWFDLSRLSLLMWHMHTTYVRW